MPLTIPLPTAAPEDDIAQYVPLLLSAIGVFLQAQDVWEPADYQQAFEYMEALKLWIVQNIPPVELTMHYFTHWHIGSKVNAGAAIGIVIDAGQIGAHIARQSTPALFDETQFSVFLTAGNYTLDVWYRGQSSSAIVDFTLTGITTINTDLYASSTTQNQVITADFTMAADGELLIKTKAVGKRAASSGYTIPITCFVLKAR